MLDPYECAKQREGTVRRWFARHLTHEIGFTVPLMPSYGAHSLTLPINLNRPLRMRFLPRWRQYELG